jgi:hypothetical protein
MIWILLLALKIETHLNDDGEIFQEENKIKKSKMDYAFQRVTVQFRQ